MSSAEPIITDTSGDGDAPAPVAAAPAVADSTASWRDSLSPDLRSNPTLSSIKDVESLAQEHVNVQKLIGTEKIARPKDDWTDEQYSEFYTKLGRPADAADYDLEGIERPDIPWDDGFEESMIGVMHKAGLSNSQVNQLMSGYMESVGGQHKAASGEMNQNREAGISDLRNEWGKSFDAQIDLAKRAFMSGAGENFESVAGLQLADGGKLGDHPSIIRAFAALGGKMNEHGLVGGSSVRSTASPSEASSEKSKLMNDTKFIEAYTNANNPENGAAVKRMNDLTIAEVGDE